MRIYENIRKLYCHRYGVRPPEMYPARLRSGGVRSSVSVRAGIISYFCPFRIFVCLVAFIFSYALPAVALAEWKLGDKPTNLTQFVSNFISLLNPVIAFVALLAFFGLLTGVLKYVGAGGDEERLGKAKELIIYGLIGMFIIFSFWGIATLLAKTYLGV